MTIIQEIQQDILDQSIKLSTVLRKAKVLAYELENEEFKEWVESELNGYPDNPEILPHYRKSRTGSFGTFVGPGGRKLTNVPIPTSKFSEEIRTYASTIHFCQGVRWLESAVENSGEGDNVIKTGWPADLILVLNDTVYQNYICIQAWRTTSIEVIEGVLDTVRNNLLTFILELKDQYSHLDGITTISKQEVSQLYQTFILGNNNMVSAGSNFSQNISKSVNVI